MNLLRRRLLLHSPYDVAECARRLAAAVQLEDRDHFEFHPGPQGGRVSGYIKKGRYTLFHAGSKRSAQLMLHPAPEGDGATGTQVECWVPTGLDLALGGCFFLVIAMGTGRQDVLAMAVLLGFAGFALFHLFYRGQNLMNYVKETLAAVEEKGDPEKTPSE